jgi:hypothetical protein
LVATANAIPGVVFAHALYGQEVSLDATSPKYVPGTTYYWIPPADLPLLDPLRLAVAPEPMIDIAEPFVRVLVDDRSIRFGESTPAQLISAIGPVTLTIQLAGAVLEGANNAAHLVDAELPGYAALAEQVAAAGVGHRPAIICVRRGKIGGCRWPLRGVGQGK